MGEWVGGSERGGRGRGLGAASALMQEAGVRKEMEPWDGKGVGQSERGHGDQ